MNKAYDTVREDEDVYGVEEKCIRVCQSLYQDVDASNVLYGQQSRWFKVENGLRQGCPYSPLLYSIYVMGMIEKLEGLGGLLVWSAVVC